MSEKGMQKVRKIMKKGSTMGELGVAVDMFLGYLSTLWVSAGALGPAAGVMRGTLGGHHGVGQGSKFASSTIRSPCKVPLDHVQGIILQCFGHSGHLFWVILGILLDCFCYALYV